MLSAAPPRRTVAPAALALCIAAALSPLAIVPRAHAQQAAQADLRRYDIPAQSLAAAAREYGRVSGLQVVFQTRVATDLQASAVQGEFDADGALRQLLSGTGLVARRLGNGTVALQAAPAATPQGAITTGTLSVDDQRGSEGGAQRDREGYDAVYDLDISTSYIGKEAVDRYKGTNPADVFKGVTGVYSGEARNSGAIDINIRGIQGPGRVPVTIDGTEQALTVWRGYNGATNRNYIDPFLIGGIQVIKGPALSRDTKMGIGGAVKISTLSVADVLKDGQTFGGDIRVEGSSNSVDPRLPTLHTGQDYRTVDGYPQFNPGSPYSDQTLRVVNKTGGGGYNVFKGGDYAYRVALGWRPREDLDFLAAYAYRERGDYYSGKRNAGYYSHEGTNYLEDYISSLATYFKPGNEVTNTSSQSESWLFKATWRPTDDQALQLGYRSSLMHYGEIMPSRIINSNDRAAIQWPLSRVDSQAWNLEYKWNPEDSRWLDLYANVWRTDAEGDTYTGGGYPNYAIIRAPILRNEAVTNSSNTRNGITLSNKIRFLDTLDLTVGGTFQHEKLRSDDQWDSSYSTPKAYPRAGRREEWEGNFNFRWQPVDFLTLTAGARYSSYWAFDDFLAAHPGQISDVYAVGHNVTYNVKQTYETTLADVQPQIDGLNEDRSLLESIGLDVDSEIQALLNSIGTHTRTVTESAAPWLPDAKGNYSLSNLACVNGAMEKVENYVENSCNTIGQISQYLYASASKHKDHGWVPAFSATFNFSDYSRAYLRYTETLRYPSMFESTIAFSAGFSQYPLKPEHGHNLEVGYVHDLSQFFSGDTTADLKLAYYSNKTSDVIERDNNFKFDNIDKQIIKGFELTGRYDNGHFFTDLGLNYQTKNEVCDKNSAILTETVNGLGNYYRGIMVPNCFKYGFPNGYLLTLATPDFSANWSLGGRFLERRLEIGGRLTYWKQYENSDLEYYRQHTYGYDGKYLSGSFLYAYNIPYSWGKTLLVDAYAKYRFKNNLATELTVTNLTDQYYVDVASRSAMAAPGRTLKLSLNYSF